MRAAFQNQFQNQFDNQVEEGMVAETSLIYNDFVLNNKIHLKPVVSNSTPKFKKRFSLSNTHLA